MRKIIIEIIKKQSRHITFIPDHLRIFNSPDGGLAKVIAKSSWGILRGLESLSQLFYSHNGLKGVSKEN